MSEPVPVLIARKHLLEKQESDNPDKDYSADWLELAGLFDEVESRVNAHYCRIKAGVIQKAKPKRESPVRDQGEFDWQSRADIGDAE